MAAAEEWFARALDASLNLALRKLSRSALDDSAVRRLTEDDAEFAPGRG
ncbi:hypothetical protein V5F32_21765 [Xanthobacter oligotrophicus]|uniref:Uncharacterized protein n=1 Tax=Xanthobacter oligotrophicus TaxID=2607286 RepID=A0ABW7A1B2_9HYPH